MKRHAHRPAPWDWRLAWSRLPQFDENPLAVGLVFALICAVPVVLLFLLSGPQP